MFNYFELMAAGRKTILQTVTVILLFTTIYLACTPRIYKASALLRVEQSNTDAAVNLASDVKGYPFDVESAVSQRRLESLQSRTILSKVVEDLNLTIQSSPRFFPLFGEVLARQTDGTDGVSDAWWGFSRWAWGGEKLVIDVFDVPDRYLGKQFVLVALENGRFRLLGPKAEVLTEGAIEELLTADIGENGRVMVKLANLVARPGTEFELVRRTSLAAVEALQNAFSVREVSHDSRIVSVELTGHDPEQLVKSVNDIASMYVSSMTNLQSAISAQTNKTSENELALINENLDDANDALNTYQREHALVAVPIFVEKLLDQAAELEVNRILLSRKLSELSGDQGNDHTDITAIGAQITRIDSNLSEIGNRIDALPDDQRTFVSLMRKVRVNAALIAAVSGESHEQSSRGEPGFAHSRIIDFAVVPDTPYWPKPGIALVVASLFGAVIGMVWVLVRYSLRQHEDGPIALENRTDLRKILDATLANSAGRVILVSCPIPGMGKSIVSANMATVLTGAQKRVLIIDADNCNACLPDSGLIANQPGLFDLLTEKASLGDVIVSLPDVGVDIIPRGELAANSIELLSSGNLPKILEQLTSFYNHIIIDLPPVLGATEIAGVAKYCDIAFLVVKEGCFSTEELEAGFRCFQQVDVTPNGFIVHNMTDGLAYYPYYEHNCPIVAQDPKQNTPPQDFMTAINDELGLVKPYLPTSNDTEAMNQSL